jgi:hypothetical protein
VSVEALAVAADIIALLNFYFQIQHFHAGVNEWLTIRNSHSEFFTWLPIGRCEVRHGSSQQARPAVMRAIKGYIGAASAFIPDVLISPQGRGLQEDATSSPLARRISPFA